MADHFRKFIQVMHNVLIDNQSDDNRNQQQMMESLFSLEQKFRENLLSTKKGRTVYKSFMDFILHDKGNILNCRIYFRERQNVFSERISKAFHEKDHEKLAEFKINYVFCSWVLKTQPNVVNKKLLSLYEDMTVLRKKIVENNLPSAIHRAKIFWSKVPESHVEYMDLIQNATEGLLNAIDKFDPPFNESFGSVVVGRMSLNIMEDHNQTLVKIPIKDKRILYRIHLAKAREKLELEDDIYAYVKQSFPKVTKDQIETLLKAESITSMDIKTPDGAPTIELGVSNQSVSDEVESRDLMNKLNTCMKAISILERKILILKNGDIPVF